MNVSNLKQSMELNKEVQVSPGLLTICYNDVFKTQSYNECDYHICRILHVIVMAWISQRRELGEWLAYLALTALTD